MPVHIGSLVEWLPISKIAELWTAELRTDAYLLERAMVEWLASSDMTIDQEDYATAPMDVSVSDGPMHLRASRELFVPREVVSMFCRESDLAPPKFWYDPSSKSAQSTERRQPGRPGFKQDYIALFDELHSAGKIDLTKKLKEIANLLYGQNGSVREKTIEQYIGERFREAKRKTQ